MSISFAPYAARLGLTWERRFGRSRDAVEVTGSLVKVDLSGFTRLSERLARSSRTGAEELNAVLNDVFAELIGLALERGGDVLQFGGDALLVWYEGDGHEQRAVAATWAQQRAVRHRPAEHTPAGPVRLRMSAGVASGEYGFVLTGQSHQELLVVGDAATRTVHLEQEAKAGQVLVDERTAAGLEPGLAEPAGAGAFLVRRSPRHDPTGPPPPTEGDGTAFVPPEVRAVEEVVVPVGEHRRAAVAFVLLSGLDATVRATGVQAAAAAVHRATEAVEAVRQRYEVAWTATDLAGDGAVYLLFAGTPVAREGDDERMLRAARELLERCDGLAVRVGVNSGRVFAADIGHPARRTFASIGDTVNLAARLMARTPVGTVQASRSVLDRAGATHELDWLAPFSVKGKRMLVEAALVGRARAGAARERTHDLPLVGRETERETVTARVAALDEGGGFALALVGPAGCGKSRLVSAARADAEHTGVTVVRAASNVHERSTPYATVRDALRSLLGFADVTTADAPEAARLLAGLGDAAVFAPLLGLPLGLAWPTTPEVDQLDPAFVEARRNEVVHRALALRRSRDLLVVEDLHWADQATLGLLEHLSTAPVDGLGLLLTSREPVAGVRDTVTLDPLPADAARRLVLAAAGERALSDLELDRLVTDGQGNPLFLRELCAYRAATDGDLPETADEVISARIDTLAPADRALLRDAAVIGFTAPLHVLAAVLDDPGVKVAARWAGLSEFVHLVPGRDVQFRHDLYRRSAYSGLSTRRRRALHGRVADTLLAEDPSAAVVAVHLHEAGRYGEAVGWARRAADEAREKGALADAAALYARAVDSARRAGQSEVLGALVEARGDVENVLGRYPIAEASYREARRHLPARAATVTVKLAGVLERLGEYRRALRELTRAAADPDDAVRCDALLRRSSVYHCAGAYHRARTVGQEALALAEHLGDPHRRALALLRLEMAADDAGDADRAVLGEAALAAFEGLDDDHNAANVSSNVGLAAFKQGDWDRAVELYARAAALYRRTGDVIYAAIAANNLAELRLEQGRLDEALSEFTEIARVFQAGGHAFGALCAVTSIGTTHVRRGEVDLGRSRLEHARVGFEEIGSRVLQYDVTLRLLEAALVEGDRALADELCADATQQRARLDDVGVLELTAARLDALGQAAAGDLDGVRAGLITAAAAARRLPSAWELAQCLHALVVLDQCEGRTPSGAQVDERDRIAAGLGVVKFPPLPPALTPAGR